MKFLDLFAGVGGFRLALEQAGCECIGFVEWDKFARKNRERVFIVGHSRRFGRREIFPLRRDDGAPDPESKNANLVQVGQLYGTEKEPNPQAGRVFDPHGISPTLDSCSGGNRMPKILIPTATYKNGKREIECKISDTVPTLLASQYKSGDTQPKIITVGNIRKNGKSQSGQVVSAKGIAPTLCATTTQKDPIKVALPILTPDRLNKRQNGRRVKNADEPMFTLTAQDRHGVILGGSQIRKLTPKECWRLQGFPDWAFEKAAAVNSNSQLYKQAGNSVTVPVVYEIAKRLKGEDD